jgi:hypothetical protein
MAQDDIDNGGLNHIVFDPNNNQERRSWKFFNYTVSRSLAVFVTQVLVAFFMIVFSCVNIYLSKRCEDSTIWIAILSSAVGYFLPNPKL